MHHIHNTQRYSWIVILGSGLILTACSLFIKNKPAFSGDQTIVFQQWDGDPGDVGAIAVIRPDGTGLETLLSDQKYIYPRWSLDGSDIYFFFNWDLNNYRVNVGRLESYRFGYGCGLSFYTSPRWYAPGKILAVETVIDHGKKVSNRIFVYDLSSCKEEQDLYSAPLEDGYFRDPDVSSQGILAFARLTESGEFIRTFDLSTREQYDLGEGLGVRWSPDGDVFVFTGADGLYLTNANGSERQKVVDLSGYLDTGQTSLLDSTWPPVADWSADGKSLIYHRLASDGVYELVIHNLANRTDTVIFRGGLYPDWR